MIRPSRGILLILAALACPALAQTTPPPSQPAPPAAPPAREPTLDELLGLPAATPPGDSPQPASTPEDDRRRELDRALSRDEGAGTAEPFTQAVDLIARTSERLRGSRDVGVETQRLQADALRKLDQLISQAQRQQQQSRSRSQQQQQDQQQQQQQQQQSQAQSQREQRTSQSAPDTQPGVARQDAQLRPATSAGGGATWGNLPAHVRDALLQGRGDRFSSMYQRLTEEYYRRLAEDPQQRGRRP